MAANARQIFNVISGNKIFSALGKKRRGNTFLGEVYWLSATEQTPTKRDAPKFECFLAGKGKHCFRNAEEVCHWTMAIFSTFCGCGAPKLFSAEKYSDPNSCRAGSLNCRTIFLPYLIGHQESLKEHKKIFKSSSSHNIQGDHLQLPFFISF